MASGAFPYPEAPHSQGIPRPPESEGSGTMFFPGVFGSFPVRGLASPAASGTEQPDLTHVAQQECAGLQGR